MKKIKFTLILVLTLSVTFLYGQSNSEGDKILGEWLVGSQKAHVKITKYGEKYGGKIVWLKTPTYEDGKPKVDKNNPDIIRKTLPLMGLSNLLGFIYTGNNTWEEGTIYDPENGKTYSCIIKMDDVNTLKVRGFIGIQMVGRTDIWKRVN